jgi:hypothetical protein
MSFILVEMFLSEIEDKHEGIKIKANCSFSHSFLKKICNITPEHFKYTKLLDTMIYTQEDFAN